MPNINEIALQNDNFRKHLSQGTLVLTQGSHDDTSAEIYGFLPSNRETNQIKATEGLRTLFSFQPQSLKRRLTMINSEFVDDKKIKDILTYIKSMKHSEQIRMMFLCSLNGMRSINFAYLQVKDCYTDQLKPNDVINLDSDKNKGKHKCSYFMNSQMKKELADYLKYLQNKWGDSLTAETYLFTSQKLNKPYNRVSISRLFSSIYNKFGIKGASHLGRHLFVSKLVNAGVNICIVQRLANHRNIGTTQHYFNYNETMLANAVENTKI